MILPGVMGCIISLWSKVVPLALKAVITKNEANHGRALDSVLTEKRDTIKTFHYDLFQALFKKDEESVNTQIESLGLSTICYVIFVLSESSKLNCTSCIFDRLRNVEKYTDSASLEYNTYKQQKWESLRESLIELVKGSETEYECKRFVHLYDESEATKVSEKFITEGTQTENIDCHSHVAITSESALNRQSETEDDLLREKGDTVECIDILEQTTEFIQPLSDIFVHEDESVVLFCELNTAGSQTEWRKNGERLFETKTVKVSADKCSHWLVFAKAKTIDTGEYSCICKNVLTSAFVKVTKQDLMVVEALHIDVDGQVKEYMDISLVCTVNAHTKNPQWFHNNKEITQSSRVVAVSHGLEHKLFIRNVQLKDDGLYVIAFDRVTSCTTITVKGEADLSVKLQLSERLYTNWVRGVLGLKYLKLGIEGVAEKEVKRRHAEILNTLPNSKQPCTQCSADSLYPLHNKKQCYRKQNKNKCLCSDYQHNRQPCPNKGYCSLFYDQVVSDHRFEHPELENTQLDRWSYDPWSVATCYINTKGYKGKGSSKEIDCAGLLSLFINNRRYLTDANYGVFDMARTTRNEILHNANYELSDDQLHEYFDNFKDVLEVKNNANKMVFAKDESIKEALKNIDKLKQHQINIVTLEEIQNLKDNAMKEAADTFKEAQKQLKQHQINIVTLEEIQKLKDHAMKEAADTFKEAQKQRVQEVQHLKEKLKKAEEELQVLRQLRSAFQRDSRLEEKKELPELVLRLGIRVVTPLGASASEVIQRVHGFIQYAVKNNRISEEDSIPPIVHTYKKTYKSVQQILGKIFVSQDTKVEVLQDQSDVSFKIKCISLKDFEKRLIIYRGVHFQEAKVDLQKSLETEDERKWKYDVETCCSSQSLKNITKQLCKSQCSKLKVVLK
ncbi:uncharacterized protein LOC123541673 [Mercenaria mercenaria]|uniref:uncharacterized protein LOC123541673 n=1 Tax=Mercenaria mercenaria TaxID=6596 RepID=UPI00234ED990|nr:uncharacterized protein LOC123541673 [Mercenaria mercenaria]